ncbi:MAG: type III-A CRISPR-associated RAMP protein Csm5 [Chitinophagales bacterium]|nr:type III-A CRISPR-associated RAMP protein Csm5 [Chitinophagales bacterium]
MNEQLNTNQNIQLTVLSPLHIGAGTEKRIVYGIDYFYDTNKKRVYIIAPDKLFGALRNKGANLNTYSSMIADNKKRELEKWLFDTLKISLADISAYNYSLNAPPDNEINTFIRSGLNTPYIPGSSLKGAIRTAIFHYLYQKHEKDNNGNLITKAPFPIYKDQAEQYLIGNFDNSIMRHIKIGDAVCIKQQLALSFVGLFNLYPNNNSTTTDWASDWKNGFSITSETLEPTSTAEFRLSIGQPFIDILSTKFNAKLPQFIHQVIPQKNPLKHLFNIINSYTQTHLEREIAFFKTYDHAEDSDLIIGQLESFLQEIVSNSNKNMCILRMAWGSGFHAISGDWQYIDHTDTGFQKNGKKKYKSRRIAYDKCMGFVKLNF